MIKVHVFDAVCIFMTGLRVMPISQNQNKATFCQSCLTVELTSCYLPL